MKRSKPVVRGRTVIFTLTLLCLVFTPFEDATSQAVRSQVTALLERLPLEKQERMKDFAETLESYINDHDWTGEISDDEIPVTIQIFLTDNSVSYESRYAGTFLITNNADIQYYDKYWRFPFEPEDPLFHDENTFHAFTGFIDFYIYLILGGEYDKYGRFLGTPFYEKAKLLSDQAMFNVQFQLGWQERTDLIDDILSKENEPFRTMKDLFFLGLSYIGEEDETARQYCIEALDLFEDVIKANPDHEQARQFIEAHHLEYVDLFRGDRDVLQRLSRLDPERADTYRQYM